MSHTHRITTAAALILSLAATGAPAASARPAVDAPTANPAPARVYDRPDREMTPVSPPLASGGAVARSAAALEPAAPPAHKASVSRTLVRVPAAQGGFDWGDAGIGAAGGIAIAMLATGGGLVLARTRRHRPETATS